MLSIGRQLWLLLLCAHGWFGSFSPTLTELLLKDNPIGEKGCVALAQALQVL